MASDNTNSGLWFDAEAAPARRDREMIPRRMVYAMFGLALASLALTTFAVVTGTPPVGRPKDAPVVATTTLTLEGRGNIVRATDATGRVLLDGNGGFIAVVLDGLKRARHVAGVTGNPPVTITTYENGRIQLTDPASGWQVELTSFGAGNTGTFLKMLNQN